MRHVGLTALCGLLLAGCATVAPPPSGLAHWQSVARQRHLAGESAAEFTRLRDQAAGEGRKQELPDLARLVRGDISPELRARTVTDTLRECVAIASVRLVPLGETVSQVAQRIHGRTLDFQTALALAEKEYLDAIVWKTPAAARRERELQQELYSRFGEQPPPGSYALAMPEMITVSPMPEMIRRHYGNDPAALLRFGGVILAMPGEFARQYAARPDFRPEGIWLEARRLAALAAIAVTERELQTAFDLWRRDPSPANLFRWRNWFYRRELELSAVPLLRGSDADLKALDSLMLLQPSF